LREDRPDLAVVVVSQIERAECSKLNHATLASHATAQLRGVTQREVREKTANAHPARK
jgi:hypothetical protein